MSVHPDAPAMFAEFSSETLRLAAGQLGAEASIRIAEAVMLASVAEPVEAEVTAKHVLAGKLERGAQSLLKIIALRATGSAARSD